MSFNMVPPYAQNVLPEGHTLRASRSQQRLPYSCPPDMERIRASSAANEVWPVRRSHVVVSFQAIGRERGMSEPVRSYGPLKYSEEPSETGGCICPWRFCPDSSIGR